MANFNELSKVVLESTYTTEDKRKIYGNKRRALDADETEKLSSRRCSGDEFYKASKRNTNARWDDVDAHTSAEQRDRYIKKDLKI